MGLKINTYYEKIKELENIIIAFDPNNGNNPDKNINEQEFIENTMIELYDYVNYLNKFNDSITEDVKKLKLK